MRPREVEIATALGGCSYPPATAQKRFARQMAEHAAAMPDTPISDRQARYLCIMAWRYRRQVGAKIVEAALDLAEERNLTNEVVARANYVAPLPKASIDHAQYVLPLLEERAA